MQSIFGVRRPKTPLFYCLQDSEQAHMGMTQSRVRAAHYANMGGWGVGSDLAWEVMPMIQYNFTDNVSDKIGYRILSSPGRGGVKRSCRECASLHRVRHWLLGW